VIGASTSRVPELVENICVEAGIGRQAYMHVPTIQSESPTRPVCAPSAVMIANCPLGAECSLKAAAVMFAGPGVQIQYRPDPVSPIRCFHYSAATHRSRDLTRALRRLSQSAAESSR